MIGKLKKQATREQTHAGIGPKKMGPIEGHGDTFGVSRPR